MTKVVLTGGPSGGKTTLAQTIQKELAPQTVVVPEAASLIFSGGFPRRVTPETKKFQQRSIYFVQRELEGLFAAENPEKLLICDRGSLDGMAYWPTADEDFLTSLGTSLPHELQRYQWIIHLDTAGKAYYDADNPLRIESYHQALELNQKVKEAWSSHPQRFVIPSTVHFIEKMELAMEIIRAILAGQSYSTIAKILK